MARHFVNPLFGDAARQLEIFSQNRLRAPILEGQLRASLAQARSGNALAGLDEQTFGSNAAVRDRVIAGPGDDPSAFLRAIAGLTLGGSNNAAINSLGSNIATIFSAPDSVAAVGQPATDNIFVGAGDRPAGGTFTGLDRILAERATGRRGRGGRSGGKLSAGGRSFLAREIKRILEDAGAENFEGTEDLIFDALDAVTSRIAGGKSENDALTDVLRSIDITQEDNTPPGMMISPILPGFIDPTTSVDREAFEPTTNSVSLGDQVTDALTGPDAGVRVAPVPENPAVVPDTDADLIEISPALLAKSLDAIARGADPAEVARFLRDNGVDPSQVLSQAPAFNFVGP